MSDLREAIRQLAFDIVVTECGLDEDDHDDQMDASERVDAWMEHWDSHAHFDAARSYVRMVDEGPIRMCRPHLEGNALYAAPGELVCTSAERYGGECEWISVIPADEASPADLLAVVRRGVESGTIKGEEKQWCVKHDCEGLGNADRGEIGCTGPGVGRVVDMDCRLVPVFLIPADYLTEEDT